MNINQPIAILGMGSFLPKARNISAFWNLLLNNESAISPVPDSLLDRKLYFHEKKGVRGKTYMSQGGLLDYPAFDQSAARYPSNVVNYVEVGHLMMIQVAAEACRQAGLDPFNFPFKNTGVYVGNNQAGLLAGNLAYSSIVEEAAQYLKELEVFRNTVGSRSQQIVNEVVDDIRKKLPKYGHDGFPTVGYHVTANAVTDAFGLNGPSFVLDAACSSSLKALSLAVQDLLLGKIDTAIVGGASFFTTDSLLLFSAAQSGSATGCFPFSEKADGLISAEGYVAVVIKPLDRALADGDPIQAVVTGIGVSSDGRGKSLWAPRKEGQVEAIRRAYRDENDMSRLDYVEAHATSTALGDQTEIEAMEEAFRGLFPTKIPVGGVKANIGHALEAAGLAGLIKTALVLQNKIVPKQINSLPLNSRIDWDALPFYVPQENTPLRQNGQPLLAAVNSFGIGGLNVHVVLEEHRETRVPKQASPRRSLDKVEPIAVVGIGAVYPGARTAADFEKALFSGIDPSSDVADRWNADVGYRSEQPGPWHATGRRGAFLNDFQYDWKRHRIPPKHLSTGDPLQFMILDSVDAALFDAGYVPSAASPATAAKTTNTAGRNLPNLRTGVIVGSTFDTDFATELCMGFRIPDFQRELRKVLLRHGITDERQIREICDQYADLLVKHIPAITDETGSFTPSTLSSRITKTYDLMGGAGTIDSGHTVGLAALDQAVNSLRAGTCDVMVCAVGARMMGLQTFVRMSLAGQLAGNGKRNVLDAETAGQIPGEGAGTLILKRLSDAQRDGDRIHFVVHGIGVGFNAAPEIAFTEAMERAWRETGKTSDCSVNDVYLIEGSAAPAGVVDQELRAVGNVYGTAELFFDRADAQFGHSLGASGMTSLLKANVELQSLKLPKSFQVDSPRIEEERLRVVRKVTPIKPKKAKIQNPRFLAGVSSWDPCGSAYHAILERGAPAPTETKPALPEPVLQRAPWKIVRFESASRDGLLTAVDVAAGAPASVFDNSAVTFRSDQPYRLAIVASDTDCLRDKLALVKKFAFTSHDAVLAQKGIFVSDGSGKGKVAFLFSGQGSQYPGMLKSLVESFGPARTVLQEIEADLTELGLPRFADLAWNDSGELGKDVFRTQLSLLCADTILSRSLSALGVSPSVVAGHSFGEFPALVASGAWTFREGAKATKVRCDTICDCKNAEGVMLSTNWDEQLAEQACRQVQGAVYVANINAPDQTILGGAATAVAEVEQYIKSRGGLAKTIPVPCPFHTPLMDEVRDPLFTALGAIETKTPSLPLFSSVTNEPVHSATRIRRNLADQMTKPVRYIDLIRQLKSDGVGIFIECGPNQVLTGIHRKILSGEPTVCLSSDAKQGDAYYLLLCIKACFDVYADGRSDGGTDYRDEINRRARRLADSGGTSDDAAPLSADEVRAAEEIGCSVGLLPLTVQALLRSEGGWEAFKKSVAVGDSNGETQLAPKNDNAPPTPISEQEFVRWSRELDGKPPIVVPGNEYSRFTLRFMKKPLAAAQRKSVTWNGRALILGQNVVAEALAKQIRRNGGQPVVLDAVGSREEIAEKIERLWQDGPLPHLFLMTPHDEDAVTNLSAAAWQRRRDRGVYLPFFATKKWYQLLLKDNLLAKATLFGATNLGGDFGFCGRIRGVEGGAITGLVKSMDLEAGFPTNFAFVAKTIDFSGEQSPPFVAQSILTELGAQIPYETEIGYVGEERFLVRPIIQAADPSKLTELPQGNWIVTGGGRGITALIAKRLSERYGVRLHLLGSSPVPNVDPTWHTLDEAGREAFKRNMLATAKQSGENVADHWRRFERAAELDTSLREMQTAGVEVRYYSCDVANRDSVQATLNAVRKEYGPISGVLHGAGVEVSSSMDRKDPMIVEKTFAVKCDGAATLMELTKDDPIRYFIGFGSIAGRMGSIGQTDYSMANDALAKLCDWYQAARPDCRVTCFHWGPWGDIGMAARPEMRNNPILATMNLLKPEEGLRHFMNEIVAGERTTETLLIDWTYYKLYYPDANIVETPPSETETKIVTESKPSVFASKSEPVHTPIRRMIVRWMREESASVNGDLTFDGTVWVIGSNRDADHLTATLSGYGINVAQTESTEDENVLLEKLDEIWQQHGPVTHLFLMTGRDSAALTVADETAWRKRRKEGFFAPFYLLRRWLRKLTEANLLDKAVVAAATSMNGDAGIQSGSAALECSGIAGLLKGLYMEQGGKDRDGVTVRIVDFPVDETPETVTECLLYELTTDGFDFETAYVEGARRVPRLIGENAPETTGSPLVEKGSVCVVTGGARGITERVARELGLHYGVKLRLIGSGDLDAVDPALLDLSESELKEQKRAVVKQAIANKKSADKEWNRVRNGIEAVRNIREMKAIGIDVEYYRCDLTDTKSIGAVFSEIVRRDGPIAGIVHGAGIDGNPATVRSMLDSQFEVADRLIAIKVDAVLEMLRYTDSESLRYFIGFGSISGRFGSASAASYCSGNDMLCKMMGQLRNERSSCRAVGIHWHAWGEIGMMTRPVSYGSVKILKMQLMPPADGLGFLVREIEAGLPENEIVVTDSQYYTLFYSDKMSIDARTPVCPKVPGTKKGTMLRSATNAATDETTGPLIERSDDGKGFCTFYPGTDPFLIDHRFRGRPLLPAVVGMEAFLETVRELYPNKKVVALHDVELREGLGFPSDDPIAATIITESFGDRISCRLAAPFVNSKGIVVLSERIYSVGTVEIADAEVAIHATIPDVPTGSWHPIRYVDEKSLMYHGPVFQQSVEALFTENDGVWSRISVRPLSQLFGKRSAGKSVIHPGTVDACLYICGVCVWLETKGAVGLPKSLKTLRLGRLPKDGENVVAHIRYKRGNESEAWFDVVCCGEDGTPLFTLEEYCCRVVPTSVRK